MKDLFQQNTARIGGRQSVGMEERGRNPRDGDSKVNQEVCLCACMSGPPNIHKLSFPEEDTAGERGVIT